jgi:hypothetical protein
MLTPIDMDINMDGSGESRANRAEASPEEAALRRGARPVEHAAERAE